MLSIGAFNALLKTLEEPPSHAVFILATTEPQRLPATILSRCQRFDFKRIPAGTIVARLRTVLNATGAQADDEAVAMIARAAEGGMRDALSILDMCLSYGGGHLDTALVREVLGASDRSFLFEFAGALIGNNATDALHMIDRLMRDGRDPAVFAREVTGHMRALLVARSCSDELEDLLETTAEDAERYRQQAGETSEARLMRLMSLFIQAENDMKWASQQRAVLELCAVRGCHPEREQEEEALLDRVATLEQAVERGIVVAQTSGTAVVNQAQPKSEEKPVAKPAPRRAPPENDAQAFEQGMKLVIKNDPGAGMLLKKGRFVGVEGDVLTIEFPNDGSELFAQRFNKPEKREPVEKYMSEAFGRPLHVQVGGQAPRKPSAATTTDGKKKLDQVYEAFPRDKIEIIDD